MKSDLGRQRAGSHVVRAAEGGEEVVHGVLIADIDRSEPDAPLVAIAVEQVVVPDGDVEQIARLHARRVAIVVLGPRSRYLQLCGTVVGRGTKGIRADRRRWRGKHFRAGDGAEKPGLKLLIGREDRSIHHCVAA